ncbi:methyltransferase [Roseimaritima ulvae]|uniref:Demethylspheroidene O-methyltransferase n=1 Tax=Roseimaritima ulvae TaxID=980254 RepID=A0A5B9QNG5_9BACT|nr:methyltransferase [Roseimaritima ulvae]QEG40514.1 Demethylspheroidene O-methyltransferase [Roseimaritima ulvae]
MNDRAPAGPLPSAEVDPTAIFEVFRGSYGSELLTAAVAHFDVFPRLANAPCSPAELQQALQLQPRPLQVLMTALRAMQLVTVDAQDKYTLTLLGERLVPGSPFDVSDYIGLAATAPGVLEMVQRLKSNQPAGLEEGGDGAAFIYRQGLRSAMDQQALSEHFTMALAGRAKNVAPELARRVDLSGATTLLDVGGGTGIYSIALMRKFPNLSAIVFDRPDVLTIAEKMAAEYGVADRLSCQSGDMFADPLPAADAILLSNILHDWDVPECRQLVNRCAAALNPAGRLIIHDVLLDDDLGGPLPIALYSAALFTLTEGRAYSAAEYRGWMEAAGLQAAPPAATAVHCHVLVGSRGVGE